MDVALAIFNIGAGLGVLAAGGALVYLAWQATPLILLSLGSQLFGQGLLVYSVGHLSPVVVGLGLLTQPVAAAPRFTG